MKKILGMITIAVLAASSLMADTVWFDKPAKSWEHEAMPISVRGIEVFFYG